ncbi:MAG: hypothetical protein H7X77_06970 [Anaerolineae bacterium]|nr:hypothetical protein [Anaerolineae bacterium]
MIRFRQQNIWWLGILSVLTLVAIVAGVPTSANSPVIPLLITMVAAAAAASFLRLDNLRRSNLTGAMQQRIPTPTGVKVSSQAKEAINRASVRGYQPISQLALTDVGLIASSRGEEGLEMRRTRSISKDDEGVRPFIVLNVAASEADRNAKLRFEMIDQSGQDLYIHEMNVYLRDGELNILADHHLPLMMNQQIEGSGEWDMRVFLDGELIAIHSLTLTPSHEERERRLGGDARPRRYVMPEAEVDDESEAIPLTLEDLMRNQKKQGR